MRRENSRVVRFWTTAAPLAMGLTCLTNIATAQAIEEIIVTANKRSATSTQETPLSVQAIGGNELKETGSVDFMDYFRRVPGLSVDDEGPGDKVYIIRGIQSTGAGTVGLYFGEVIVTGFNNQPDLKMFDIDRIEVLKGPQGTTFGSSSLSGTIRWIPNTPQYDRIESDVGIGLTTLRHSDDLGTQVEGMINVPLIEDKAAIRISGLLLDRVGYVDTMFEDDANYEDSKAIRGMFAWRVTDELELSTFGMFQNMNVGTRNFFNDTARMLPMSDTLNGQDLPGEYYQGILTRGSTDDDTSIYNAQLVLDKSWGTVTGTYSVFDRFFFRKGADSEASELLFGLPADENPAYLGHGSDRQITSTEIRFASRWEGPFQILAGAFYQQEDRDQVTNYVFTDPITGRDLRVDAEAARRETHTSVDEIAMFGEVSWELTDQLTLTGGGRWFDQSVDEQVNVIMGYIYQPGTGPEEDLDFGFDDVIFKANLSYELSDDLLFFTQIAEGYRYGGPNDRSAMERTNVFIPPGFESDSLINYEIGLKSTLLNGQLLLNSSIYFMDWSDIQVQQQAIAEDGNIFSYRGNGGGAEVKGVEMELAASPIDGLSIGATLNYLDAKLTADMPIARDGLKGDRIPYTPEISGSANVRYERPVSNELTGFIAGDWSYYGDTTNQFRPDNGLYYRPIDSYTLTNVRGGMAGDDWSLVLAVNNVFDADDVISYTFDYTAVSFPEGVFLPDNKARPWPREISIMFRKEFF